MKKNLFLTMMFSFIPGAGQMYQEYMKRGVSIMILAGIFCILAAITGSVIFIVPILITEAFSFFDTFNIRNNIDENKKEDDYIWNGTEISKLFDIEKITKNKKIIAYILIVIGSYLLLDTVIVPFLIQLIPIDFICNLLYRIKYLLPNALIGVATIYVGLKMLGVKKEEK